MKEVEETKKVCHAQAHARATTWDQIRRARDNALRSIGMILLAILIAALVFCLLLLIGLFSELFRENYGTPSCLAEGRLLCYALAGVMTTVYGVMAFAAVFCMFFMIHLALA